MTTIANLPKLNTATMITTRVFIPVVDETTTATTAQITLGELSGTILEFVSARFQQGIQGPQGPSNGVTGSQGIAGSQGAQGIQGRAGFLGAQGTQGSQGMAGITGRTGDTGFIGPQGTTGMGTQGYTGSQGTTGSQGSTGSQGTTGSQGSTGSTGTQGISGVQGITGIAGTQGIHGSTGAQGAVGAQGPQGQRGSDGVGSQGPAGSAQGAQGIQGASGSSTVLGLYNSPLVLISSGLTSHSTYVTVNFNQVGYLTSLSINPITGTSDGTSFIIDLSSVSNILPQSWQSFPVAVQTSATNVVSGWATLNPNGFLTISQDAKGTLFTSGNTVGIYTTSTITYGTGI